MHGALKDASGEEANAFAAEDIDEILSRRAEHRDVGPLVGNSFSVATFGAEPGDGVDDETFWAEAFGDAAIQAAKEKAAEQVVDKRFAVEGPRKRKTVNYKESVALFQNQTPSLAPCTGTRTMYSERRAAAKRAREEDKKLRQEEREARRREREEELARQREDAKLNWFTWEVEVVVDALSAFGAPNGDASRAVACGTLDVDKPDEQKIAVAKTVMEMFDTIVRVRD